MEEMMAMVERWALIVAALDCDSGEMLLKTPSGTGPPTGAAPPTPPSRVPITLLSTGLSATFGEGAGVIDATDATTKNITQTPNITCPAIFFLIRILKNVAMLNQLKKQQEFKRMSK